MTAMSCKNIRERKNKPIGIDFYEYPAVSLTSTTKNDLILYDCLFYLEAGAKRIFAIRFAACLIWLKIKMSQKPAERDDKNVRRGNL